MCFPLIVLYCCYIPEGKGMSCQKHVLTSSRPCELYMATESKIQILRHVECRTMKNDPN